MPQIWWLWRGCVQDRYIHKHIYIHAYIYVHICIYAHITEACIHIYTHTHQRKTESVPDLIVMEGACAQSIHAYIHIHTKIHVCTYVHIHTIQQYTKTYIHMCTYVVFIHTICVRTLYSYTQYTKTYIHTCTCTHLTKTLSVCTYTSLRNVYIYIHIHTWDRQRVCQVLW